MCFFSWENHSFLSAVKPNAKNMSVHLNVSFCSDIAIFGILLCAELEEVAAF